MTSWYDAWGRSRHQRRLLGVSGPSGAGKSTVARLLAAQLGCVLVDEPIPIELLALYASAPNHHAVRLQEAIIAGRLSAATKVIDDHIVFDRTLGENKDVFLALHHVLGALDDNQVAYLRRVNECAERSIGPLSAIIFVTAEERILRERLLKDTKHERPKWLLDSLTLQTELYKQWRLSISTPCVDLDTSTLRLKEVGDFIAHQFQSFSGFPNF